MRFLQGGPLLVINGVKTPMNGVTGVITLLIGGICYIPSENCMVLGPTLYFQGRFLILYENLACVQTPIPTASPWIIICQKSGCGWRPPKIWVSY